MPFPKRELGVRLSSVADIGTGAGRLLMKDASAPAMATGLRLPSFLVVGPPRTGTSWLHEVLRQHVNLPDPTKETRFFDVHFALGMKWYRAHFPASRANMPVGEIAPTYFASTQARERIARCIPNAKLIFIFRNPAQRLISLYRVKRAYGLLPWSLEDAIHRDPELMLSGMYATIFREWQRDFPRQQLLITIYDDLRNNPQAFLDTLTEFLGIPRISLTDAQLRKVHGSDRMTEPRSYLATRTATLLADWCKARRLDGVVAKAKQSVLIKLFLGGGAPFPEVSQEALHKISDFFRSEVEGLEAILNRDLSHWKNHRA